MIAPPADCNTSQTDKIVLAIVAFIGLEKKKNVDPISVVLLPPFLLVLVLAKGNCHQCRVDLYIIHCHVPISR